MSLTQRGTKKTSFAFVVYPSSQLKRCEKKKPPIFFFSFSSFRSFLCLLFSCVQIIFALKSNLADDIRKLAHRSCCLAAYK